jgi:hypothetical protein
MRLLRAVDVMIALQLFRFAEQRRNYRPMCPRHWSCFLLIGDSPGHGAGPKFRRLRSPSPPKPVTAMTHLLARVTCRMLKIGHG